MMPNINAGGGLGLGGGDLGLGGGNFGNASLGALTNNPFVSQLGGVGGVGGVGGQSNFLGASGKLKY